METQTTNTNGRRVVGIFANYENLADAIEVHAPIGRVSRLYEEYLHTEESEEHGFSRFYHFLETNGIHPRILPDPSKHSFDESFIIF